MIRRLRALWDAPAAIPAPPKRVWRDWALIAIVPIVAILEGMLRADVPATIPAVVLTIAAVPTLLWRRTHPLLMLVIAFVITEGFRVISGVNIELFALVYVLLLVYSVFRWGSGRAIVIGALIMIGTTSFSVFTTPFDLTNIIGSFAIILSTVTVALLFRARAGARLREVERVKSNEREELARDLHDTVAHHVSAIAIQAQAGLATVDSNPDAAADALRIIEAEASRTLTEMRSMVRVLRDDDTADLAPAPTVADLGSLADHQRGGPVVDVQVTGDVEGLAAPVAAAVYRIAQESITNARRHARGATRIDVRLSVESDGVRLTVHDDGASGIGGVAAAAPGYGITGMAERAALLGGTCTAGRDPDGGWTVTADLPRTGAGVAR